MWHWNTLWAPAPGDPPAVDDPKLFRTPWTPEQAFVLQARMWDTAVSATRAWWSFWMASAAPFGNLPFNPTSFPTPPAPGTDGGFFPMGAWSRAADAFRVVAPDDDTETVDQPVARKTRSRNSAAASRRPPRAEARVAVRPRKR